MYCRNCGAEIDSDAKFCPLCGFDQGFSGTYAPPGSGSQSGSSWTFTGSSSKDKEKQSMVTGFIIALLLSIILGLLWAVVVGVILLILYIIIKKDTGSLKSVVIGGVIGLVVGYLINLFILGLLIASMY